jgi:hypothetical protein
MVSRAGRFSAAYSVHLDERAQLAEELMSSIDQDDDDDDEEEARWMRVAESTPPRYAPDEEGPVSEDRWENTPLRLTGR